jgi:hypothetical protein
MWYYALDDSMKHYRAVVGWLFKVSHWWLYEQTISCKRDKLYCPKEKTTTFLNVIVKNEGAEQAPSGFPIQFISSPVSFRCSPPDEPHYWAAPTKLLRTELEVRLPCHKATWQGLNSRTATLHTTSEASYAPPEPEFGSTFPAPYIIYTTFSFICQVYPTRASKSSPSAILLTPSTFTWVVWVDILQSWDGTLHSKVTMWRHPTWRRWNSFPVKCVPEVQRVNPEGRHIYAIAEDITQDWYAEREASSWGFETVVCAI